MSVIMFERKGLGETEGVFKKQQNVSRRRNEINAKILQTDALDGRRVEETRTDTG